MGAKEKPLYSIYNMAVDNNGFSTGQCTFSNGNSNTILLDFEIITNSNRSWKFFIQWNDTANHWTLTLGKNVASSSVLCLNWCGSSVINITNLTPSPGRLRIAITHEANSDKLVVHHKRDNGTKYTQEFTKTYSAVSNSLIMGSIVPSQSSYYLPKGTINKLEIWDRVKSTDELNSFFT